MVGRVSSVVYAFVFALFFATIFNFMEFFVVPPDFSEFFQYFSLAQNFVLFQSRTLLSTVEAVLSRLPIFY